MQKFRLLMASVLAKASSLALLFCVLVLFFTGVFSYTRAGTPMRVYAAPTSTLNFQGRLLTSAGATVPDGYYNLEFKLYDALSGGSNLWDEAYYDSNGAAAGSDNRVRVVNGYFSVNLGSQAAFPGTINWDQEHWLTMNVGGSTQTATPVYDGEMTPRLKLTAVPYAFSAGQLRRMIGSYTSVLDFLTPTADRTLNLPDQNGTLCVQGSPDCVDVVTTNTTATTSSNSGLEISTDGLRLLGGCSSGQSLEWNSTTKVWECGTDGASNSFETFNAPSGTDPVADSGSDTLDLLTTGSNFTVTGNSTTDSLTYDIIESSLAGNGLVATGDALDVTAGNGLEIASDAVRVNQDFTFTWTAPQTWNLNDTEGLSVNSTVGGTSNSQANTVTITNSSTSGTQSGVYIDNAANAGTTEALLVLDNSDTNTAVTSAIQVINAGGGFTNLFDIAGTLISSGEFTVLDGGVTLGTETNGDYVQNIGTLTGLSVSGNSGEGSTPGLSVLYGSGANNAAAGTNTFTCNSGSGNLSGGGTVVTLGTSGTSCGAITTNAAVSFGTSVTSPLFTGTGAVTLSSGGSSGLTLDSASNTISIAANDTALQRSAAGTYTIDLLDAGAATTLALTNSNGSQVANLTVEGSIASVGLNAGSGLIQGTGGLTTSGSTSLNGAISDPNSNLVLDDIVDIGSATTGLRVAVDGSILDIDSNLVLDDQVAVGSSTTGLLVTTDGGITDIDDPSITFGENVTVSTGGLTITGGIDNNTGNITETGSITGVGPNITGTGAVTLASGGAGALSFDSASNVLVLAATDTTIQRTAVGTTTIDLVNAAATTLNLTNSGASVANFTLDGLLTGTGGLTVSGAAVSLNASSNFAVNIGTGTSTGAVSIGGGGNTFSVNSTTLDISTAGVISGITGLVSGGNTGSTIAACAAGQYIGNGVRIDDGLVTAGSCRNDNASDVRLKKNIVDLDSSVLDDIKNIRTTSYDFRCDETQFANSGMDCSTPGRQTGVLAQQLATIFPDLVYLDSNGYYSVRYNGLTVYNTRALVELSKHIDSSGNGDFKSVQANALKVDGVLEAGTIRADHIEGLDYVGRFESLEARVDAVEAHQDSATQPPPNRPTVDLDNLSVGKLTASGAVVFKESAGFEKKVSFGANVTIGGQTDVQNLSVNLDLVARGSLEVIGPATFKQAVRFEKDALFQGRVFAAGDSDLQKLTVNLELIAKGSLEVQGPATFKEAVRFEKDATFEGSVAVKGQATFNNDTAGYATIKKDESTIEVKFKNPKERKPIITLTLGEGVFAQYSYRNASEEGFEIVLSRPAVTDLVFSWVAIQTEEEVIDQP